MMVNFVSPLRLSPNIATVDAVSRKAIDIKAELHHVLCLHIFDALKM